VHKGATVTDGNGEGEIPESVFDDMANNPLLVRRWVQDPSFRQSLLNAEDVGGFLTGQNFRLQQATLDWIEERIQFRGAELLADRTSIVAF